LLRFGNGTEDTITNDYVRVSDDIVIEYKSDESIDTLTEHVFPDVDINCTSMGYMHERGILSIRNEHVDGLNARMIERFPSKQKVYYI
jgi:ATP-dependent DNA helicase PIF1